MKTEKLITNPSGGQKVLNNKTGKWEEGDAFTLKARK